MLLVIVKVDVVVTVEAFSRQETQTVLTKALA